MLDAEKMAKSVVAFLMPAPLLIWTALLAAQLSAAFDVRVRSSNVCGSDVPLESDYCCKYAVAGDHKHSYNTLIINCYDNFLTIELMLSLSKPLLLCVPTDDNPVVRNDLWQANINCSVPNTLKLEIKDLSTGDRSSFAVIPEMISEVRIQCTDGNAQVGTMIPVHIITKILMRQYNASDSACIIGWVVRES